jgi:hypothetical protein
MSRFATSSPFLRRSGSSTIHSANPIRSAVFSPASATRVRSSFSVPPPFRCSSTSDTHGSNASYPAFAATSIRSTMGRDFPSLSRTVLVLRQ